MALILENRQADGPVARTRLQPGVNRVPVDIGSGFRLFDERTGFAPGDVRVMRVDNDLVIEGLKTGEGDQAATVELPEYYSLCSAAMRCIVRFSADKPVVLPIKALSLRVDMAKKGC